MFYLCDLIAELKRHDPNKVLKLGFKNPHSYRGYYDQLAFEPAENVTIGSMLACAKRALWHTYEGYRGGKYKMDKFTPVNLAEYGCCGDPISFRLLNYMLKDTVETI